MNQDNKPSYSIRAARDFSRVAFAGTLRFRTRQEYEKILVALRYATRHSGDSLEIDFRDLQFLNSIGIATVSLFLIETREVGKKVTITGSKTIAWQNRVLYNLSRLNKNLTVNLS